MSFSDEYKNPLTEIWGVQLYYDNEGGSEWLGVSTAPCEIFSTQLHPIIVGSPSIKKSIDLVNSRSKTSNITIKVINIDYHWTSTLTVKRKLSEELLSASGRKYINRKVLIRSRLLDQYETIYTGRLVDISHDMDFVTLTITDKRPTDFISMPNLPLPTPTGIRSLPIAYGDFHHQYDGTNIHDAYPTYSNEKYLKKDVWRLKPCPYIKSAKDIYRYSLGLYGNTGGGQLFYFDKGMNAPVPLTETPTANPQQENSYYHSDAKNTLIRGFMYHPTTTEPIDMGADDDGTGLINSEDAMDFDESFSTSYARINPAVWSSGGAMGEQNWCQSYQFPRPDGIVTSSLSGGSNVGKIVISWGVNTPANVSNQYGTIQLYYGFPGAGWTLIHSANPSAGFGQSGTTTVNLSAGEVAEEIYLRVRFAGNNTSILAGMGYFTNVCTLNEFQSSPDDDPPEIMYSPDNGYVRSWDTGNGATKVHEVHRDILQRFAGETGAGDYSALDTARTNWRVHWSYEVGKTELIEKHLQRLQYEGGFIYLYGADGNGKYVYAKTSYDANDVDYFLNENDIANIQIRKTPFSELMTKMTIKSRKILGSGNHGLVETFSNSSARTNWNIQTKENIKEEKMEFLIDTDAGNSTCQGFYDHHNSLHGDIRILVSCDIVNPDKVRIDIGDIVKFGDDGITGHNDMSDFLNPFGYEWGVGWFMVTSISRKIGQTRIECREVYRLE